MTDVTNKDEFADVRTKWKESRGDRWLESYYFRFNPTGVDCIDEVLAAVCGAGKAYHHTESWNDDGYYGKLSPADEIDAAAREAASAHAALAERVRELEEAAIRGETENLRLRKWLNFCKHIVDHLDAEVVDSNSPTDVDAIVDACDAALRGDEAPE